MRVQFLVCALGATLAAFALVPGGYAEDGSADPERVGKRPNIILMLADDQAWDGLSVPMHPHHAFARSRLVRTPHLETLAEGGMRFTAGYAPAPVCAPTRISLQTGRSPAALHWTRAGPSVRASAGPKLVPPVNIRDLPDDETTIGELLRAAGYATAHLGKWHIGGGGPARHGYDVHDGDLGNEAASRFKDPNPVDIFGMAERATAFMQACKERQVPFFLQLSWLALHAPENARAASVDAVRARTRRGRERVLQRAALAEDLDAGVGRVLAALDELHLTGDTYVVYMGDNGGPGGGGRRAARAGGSGLAGGKGSLGEGGIRVPFIVRGPGIAEGTWSHAPVTGMDLYPTFAAWAGVRTLPKGLEGGDLGAVLGGSTNAKVSRPREEIVFHFPHYQDERGPQSAILLGSMKLLRYYEDKSVALFDLETDIRETHDLSGERPDDAADLSERLAAYLKSVGAQMPQANPSYDASRPYVARARPERRGRRPADRD